MFRKLVWALRYLFYRSYVYQLKQWKGDTKTAAVAATGSIAVAIFINALTVLALALSFLHKRLSEITILPGLPPIKVAYLAAAGVLIFAQMLYLFYTTEGRDRQIVEEYSTEEPSIRKTRTAYIYTYIIVTIGSFILSLIAASFSAHST